MSRITWTSALRVELYTAVIAALGHPCDVARGSRGKPIGMSKADYIDALNVIGDQMGFGPDKGGALSNQIAWVTCVPSAKCHQGHWNNRSKNCSAALDAGYLSQVPLKITLKPDGSVDEAATVIDSLGGTKLSVCRRLWNSVKSIFS